MISNHQGNKKQFEIVGFEKADSEWIKGKSKGNKKLEKLKIGRLIINYLLWLERQGTVQYSKKPLEKQKP